MDEPYLTHPEWQHCWENPGVSEGEAEKKGHRTDSAVGRSLRSGGCHLDVSSYLTSVFLDTLFAI